MKYLEKKAEEKAKLAEETIKRCIGKDGFYASADLYLKQYWIRDMVYSIEPLLNLGYSELVKKHLTYTLKRQKPSGEIPARILETPPPISKLYRQTKILFERSPKLLFRRPLTYDSNLLTLIGVYRYAEHTGDEELLEDARGSLGRVWGFIKGVLVDGLLPEADWRDAMLNYTSRWTFCNQILLITANRLAGRLEEAEQVEDALDRVFWDEDLGYYRDHQKSTHFDTMGHALAILEGLIPPSRLRSVLKGFEAASTKFGFRSIQPSYREEECGQKPWYYQNSTVWPLIQGFAVAALAKSGVKSRAEEEFNKLVNLPGFNEWYNPSTGEPNGSADQLCSATSYLRAYTVS